MAAALLLCISTCPVGEFLLYNCTSTRSAVCWPCETGFACNTTSRIRCIDGVSWSNASSASCFPCTPGWCPGGTVLVRECSATSDRVCAPCPESFRCVNGTMERRNSTQCAPGETAAGSTCRVCPEGYGCANERIELCGPNTYSLNGTCAPCPANSQSPAGSRSSDECACDAGYVRAGGVCSCCKEGTVWKDGRCELCEAGSYCMGKLHQETCPRDMYSLRGAAECIECRPFSSCQRHCAGAASCVCDDGYIFERGGCRRCGPGTAKADETSCARCAPGMQCLGGAEVAACRLSTYSPGNLTRCVPCTLCPELTRARCNATHDSECVGTREPLAVILVHQEYRTAIDGETFGAFAAAYTSALPKAQLQSVCDERRCVDCFQGLCSSPRALSGPVYRTVIEIRSETNRLVQNVEALANTAFLLETAKAAMRRVTEAPFAAYSRVDHEVICPDEGASWDGGACVQPRDSAAVTTWLGLVLGVVMLVAVAVYGGRKKGVN